MYVQMYIPDMKTARVNLRIEPEILQKARKLGFNISEICRNAIKEAIRARKMVRPPGFEPGSSAWKAGILVQARLRPLLTP